MAFNYLENAPLDEAVERYLAELRGLAKQSESERVKTGEAASRVTARAVYAKISAPHYNACAMDGIALKASATFGASETTPVFVADGAYTEVDTGDPLPEGCDAVVMIEDVIRESGGVRLYSAAAPWQHVRQIGEDMSASDMIAPSYTEITPASAGAMLAGGVLEVEVLKKPVVGIIPTGDEIVAPTDSPKSGDVIEFNSAIFSAMLLQWGAVPKVYPVVKDNPESVEEALKLALSECGAVIINAGSSAGREDYTSEAVSKLGEVLFHGLAIRPGKPAVLGICGSKPVIGVPGYPVSGIVVMERVARPVIELLTKKQSEKPATASAVVSRRLVSSLKYREFVRTRLGWVDGRLIASPLSRGAGVISSFVKADGIINVPQNKEGYEAGEGVEVELLAPLELIKSTLVVTGSHDPLIDEIADIERRSDASARIASSHVGSMGAITALRRGEAHLGGIHLLNEEDGRYNEAYLKRYFPGGSVVLIEGVKRVQGLMVEKGNPKGITTIADLAGGGVRFANRQGGSGTRVLLDYLLKRCGCSAEDIDGYAREELTHTAVAAQIASGTADAGLGIYSAARMYGLDFVPVCDEEYDFAVLESALELPAVKRFFEILGSDEFAERLKALGGYSLGNPGREKIWN